jgi:hypothetical protein
MMIRRYDYKILRRSCAIFTLFSFLAIEWLAPPPGHTVLLHILVVIVAIGAAATWYSTRSVSTGRI